MTEISKYIDTFFIPTEETSEFIVRVNDQYYLVDEFYRLITLSVGPIVDNDSDDEYPPYDFSDVVHPDYNYYTQNTKQQ